MRGRGKRDGKKDGESERMRREGRKERGHERKKNGERERKEGRKGRGGREKKGKKRGKSRRGIEYHTFVTTLTSSHPQTQQPLLQCSVEEETKMNYKRNAITQSTTFKAPHSSTVGASGTTLILNCGLSKSSFSTWPCSSTAEPGNM